MSWIGYVFEKEKKNRNKIQKNAKEIESWSQKSFKFEKKQIGKKEF